MRRSAKDGVNEKQQKCILEMIDGMDSWGAKGEKGQQNNN